MEKFGDKPEYNFGGWIIKFITPTTYHIQSSQWAATSVNATYDINASWDFGLYKFDAKTQTMIFGDTMFVENGIVLGRCGKYLPPKPPVVEKFGNSSEYTFGTKKIKFNDDCKTYTISWESGPHILVNNGSLTCEIGQNWKCGNMSFENGTLIIDGIIYVENNRIK